MKNKILRNTKPVLIGIFTALTLISGITFAQTQWLKKWHNPNDWIQPGRVISSKQLGESLNYLYNKVQNGLSVTLGTMVAADYFGARKNVRRDLICPPGYVMVGLRADGGYHGGFVGSYIISGLQPICQRLNGATLNQSEFKWVKIANPVCQNTGVRLSSRSCGGNFIGTITVYQGVKKLYNCQSSTGIVMPDSFCDINSKPQPDTASCTVEVSNCEYAGR